MEPIIIPLKNPTFSSLRTKPNCCLNVSSSSVNTLIVTASDCVPTLPDIPSITDWKLTMTGSVAITCSNIPVTDETPSPSISNITSHGILFFKLSTKGSSKSSSDVKAANLA